MHPKCVIASKQWNVPKHDMRLKCVLASKQGNVRKWNKESSIIEGNLIIKV